jgi:hypothetical protein
MLYAFLISPMLATCSALVIPLDLIIIISDEEYNLWNCSLCNFLNRFLTSSLLDPNILPGPCSQASPIYELF